MTTCKDCIHYDICIFHLKGNENENCVQFMNVADVASRSEVNKLEYTLSGVMHSVDKWLEDEELKQDEVNRAITMREKTLRIIENAKTEIDTLMANKAIKEAEIETLTNALKVSKIIAAQEIFDEIEQVAMSKIDVNAPISTLDDIYYLQAIDEVRDKYT